MQNPKIHFYPEKGWMNDPNGLFFLNGYYHLFYQYNPNDIVWGPMHWGHARSKDLISWEYLPIAMFPDDLGQIFSGSIVYDRENTSGLFHSKPGLIAIYTNHLDKKEIQSIAYSNDEGITWTKYSSNPVLTDNELVDFRDPKVLWIDDRSKWLMILACGDHIRIYESSNLINWQYSSSFNTFDYDVQTPLECPDLINLKDETTNKYKWLLKVDVSNHPAGGPGAICILGDLELEDFTFIKDETQSPIWVDAGQDFYAAASWSNMNEDIPLWIGWMNNWRYANTIPENGTRGIMSLPRYLSLVTKNDQTQLKQHFPRYLYLKSTQIDAIEHKDSLIYDNKNSEAFFIDIKNINCTSFRINIDFEKNNLFVNYDSIKDELIIDRSNTTSSWSHKNFNEVFKLNMTDTLYNLEIVIDANSIELLANDGVYSVSLLHFAFAFAKRVSVLSLSKESIRCWDVRTKA